LNDLGLSALEYGGRIDFARLRRERRARLVSALREAGLDALILGREANARYAAGARRLWTAGGRPFAPGCVVLASGAVHVMSTWDEGVPEEVGRAQLYGGTWDPARLVQSLAAIPGLASARRVGVDGMSASFARRLPRATPKAEWLDASGLLERVRRIKTADELACIRTAVAVAEGALAAVRQELAPGVRERALVGRFHAEASRLGVTTTAFEGTFCAGAPLRRIASERRLAAGDLVACDAGVLYAGYEGLAGCTWLVPGVRASEAQRDLVERARALRAALLEAARPGARVTDLCRIYAEAGEPLPRLPVVQGVGLGMEPPIAGAAPSAGGARLEAGMSISLATCIERPAAGACLLRDVVIITRDGPERVTRLSDETLLD
jgi:Xaa-Pro aminopeptidase